LAHQIKNQEIISLVNHPLNLKTRVYPLTFNDRHKKLLLPTEFMHRLQGWIRTHQRVFILHNRRGSWSAVICRKCRASLKCRNCDIALTVHGHGKTASLLCHQCGFTEKLPDRCPLCRTGTLRTFGVASQRAAEVLQHQFKRTKVTIIDKESLSQPGLDDRLKVWRRRHLFIGTTAAFSVLPQLNITRSVLLMPEQLLLYPDFRSEERVLRHIIRLGEYSQNQTITLVTRFSRMIQEKLDVPLEESYARILLERKRLKYPPLNTAVKLSWQATSNEAALKKATLARKKISPEASVIIRGPFQSYQKRRRQQFEAHLLFLGDINQLKKIYSLLKPDSVDLNPARIL
jgi:primosomal protein N' (replication factor Y) (superfamily II helicase)